MLAFLLTLIDHLAPYLTQLLYDPAVVEEPCRMILKKLHSCNSHKLNTHYYV